MTLGAMQPYLFPYLGYFQLMDCVDTYVFCGDLQYIRHGWVNRNRIRINRNLIQYFTFSIVKDDYKKRINQRRYGNLKADCDKLKRHLYQNYKKAVNFEETYSVLEEVMRFQEDNVAYFNMNANYIIARYLGIKSDITCTDIIEDEEFRHEFYQLDRENRVVRLCRHFNARTYVNAIGGVSLYHKDFFVDKGIKLLFIKMDDIAYPQFGNEFDPNLSIIDVMMHNKIDAIMQLMKKYRLE